MFSKIVTPKGFYAVILLYQSGGISVTLYDANKKAVYGNNPKTAELLARRGPTSFRQMHHICPFMPCNGGFRDRIRICGKHTSSVRQANALHR